MDKMVHFLSLEEKKGSDDFNPMTFAFFYVLFLNFLLNFNINFLENIQKF